MKNSRLDFLVIGAQKCATSWLFYCLAEHPSLHLPKHKREIWYIGGDLYEKNGIDWYMNLLEGASKGQLVGDVSVEYLYDTRAAPAVAAHFSQLRLIVSLRDPIERAKSAYYWKLRKRQFEGIGLEEALSRGLNAAQEDRHKDESFVDIIRRGEYGEQLQLYIDHYGPSSMLYLIYEDIAREPLGSLKQVYRFLGCEEGFHPPSLESRPKQNTYNKTLIALERMASGNRLAGRAVDYINQLLTRFSGKKDSPDISLDLEMRLREYYAPSLEKIQSMVFQAPPENRPKTDISSVWRTAK